MEIKQLLRADIPDDYGLHKMQNIILNIMSYIDQKCRDNDIEYYIIGGTALGAVRHGGFIPWDDDLDIAMTRDNYDRFCTICRSQIDEDFFFQEGGVDWPLFFSKLRLKGTVINEVEGTDAIPKEERGIFVDIFPLDNVPNGIIKQYWWYICGKLLVAYSLRERGYKSASFVKKVAMTLAAPLGIALFRNFAFEQVLRYNSKHTNYIGCFSMISRFRNTISPISIWSKPININFERCVLMAPGNINGFLSFYFGNYMQLPPEEKRRCGHIIDVDYGKY